MMLYEANKCLKIFNEEEGNQIIEGTVDVTEFFENKEESTKRLMDALKGRPVYPGQKERDDLQQRATKLKEEIKAFRLKYRIEDPPQHAAAAGRVAEVSSVSNRYRSKRLRRRNRENEFDDETRVSMTESASDDESFTLKLRLKFIFSILALCI
jgi:hypothetical protein